jgi:hypothetical protein
MHSKDVPASRPCYYRLVRDTEQGNPKPSAVLLRRS